MCTWALNCCWTVLSNCGPKTMPAVPQLAWTEIPPGEWPLLREMDLTIHGGSSLYPWETENPFIGSAPKPDWRKWITGNRSVPAVIMLQCFCRTRPWGGGALMARLLFYCKLFFAIFFFNRMSFSYCHKCKGIYLCVHTHSHTYTHLVGLCYTRRSDPVLTVTFTCFVEEHALKKLHL